MRNLGIVLCFVLLSGIAVAEVEVYTIEEGDTLEQIANNRFEDTKLWIQLAKYNEIANPDLIKTGQNILIPPKADLILKSREKGNLEARIEELERRIAGLQYSTPTALFEDNFEDDDLSKKPKGWLFPSGGKWGISADGSRMLEQADRRASNSAALFGEKEWSNYIVQVELKIDQSGDAGVFAYWNSHLGNYRLRTHDRHSKLMIAKRVPTGPNRYNTEILKGMPLRLEDDRWYIFKLEVTTHGSYTYLKGKLWRKGETEPGTWFLEASDHSSSRYKIGLAGVWTKSSGTSYRGSKFDNFGVFTKS